jgi:hypothetical protein
MTAAMALYYISRLKAHAALRLRLVAVHASAGKYVGADELMDRLQESGAAAHLRLDARRSLEPLGSG